ncbi:MAG: radical SAM protein [bacterium]|nr:radical SAM protein [bacterium]
MIKSKFLKRNQAAEKPKYWLRLTRLCNNNCVFCLDKENRKGTIVKFSEIKAEVKKARKQGSDKLILSGGEPTLHPDYLEIIRFARQAGFREIQTVTNGRMFAYRNFLKKALENGLTETTFSFHGHTRELYEKQSGIKGSYEQAFTGLTNVLNSKGLIVNIDIVINKINYRYLDKVIKFFLRLGIREFDLLQVVPFGSAWDNRDKVFYNLEKALPFIKKAFSLQHQYPDIYLWTNRLPAQYLEGFEELIQHPVKLYDEIRGRKKILERFIDRKVLMRCYDKQCPYCYIENFCKDLIELRRAKRLAAREPAVCLRKGSVHPPKVFLAAKRIDLEKFLDFYIEHRYFLKSLRCRNCRDDGRCEGAPINLIRKKGFRILSPSRKK